jgi:hypothetical protein
MPNYMLLTVGEDTAIELDTTNLISQIEWLRDLTEGMVAIDCDQDDIDLAKSLAEFLIELRQAVEYETRNNPDDLYEIYDGAGTG